MHAVIPSQFPKHLGSESAMHHAAFGYKGESKGLSRLHRLTSSFILLSSISVRKITFLAHTESTPSQLQKLHEPPLPGYAITVVCVAV